MAEIILRGWRDGLAGRPEMWRDASRWRDGVAGVAGQPFPCHAPPKQGMLSLAGSPGGSPVAPIHVAPAGRAGGARRDGLAGRAGEAITSGGDPSQIM